MAEVISSPEEVTLSFPILKTDHTPDGDLLVYGRVTDGTVDTDSQIVNSDWSGKALKSWLSTGGNLRVQHQAMRDPAGVGLEVDIDKDGDGAHWLKALVVEPVARRLVEKGALRAFSVGIMRPKITRHSKAIGGEIVDGELGEVSLVDRPANRNCAFALVKADKSGEPQWVGEMEGDADTILKMVGSAPSPKVIAKMLNERHEAPEPLPQPDQGEIPGGPFADPVARRLNEVLAAEKRDFSAAQRASAADSGSAMSDGSFLIKNGEDLGNAIHLAGHAKDPAAARAHIKSRAAALGLSDKIPDTWKADGSDVDIAKQAEDALEQLDEAVKADGPKCGSCHGSGKIRNGTMSCPDCTRKPSTEKPPAKTTSMPSSSKASAPKPDPDSTSDEDDTDDAAGDGDENKSAKPPSKDTVPPAKNVVDPSTDDDDASGSGSNGYAGNKTLKLACSACGCGAKKSAAFCAGCGAAFAGKKKGGDPASGVKAKPGTKRAPVPSEGSAERTEITSAGKPKKGKAILAASGTEPVGQGGTSKAEAPYSMARAHDAFCAAWDAATVLEEYPSLKSIADALVTDDIRDAAVMAMGKGEYGEAAALSAVAAASDALKSVNADEVADARAALHKSFTDMYPSAHPTPGSIMAQSFQRPYISSGHAPLSAEAPMPQPPARIPPEAKPASSFRRGNITAGHEAASPSSKAADTVYRMTLVHDHIAGMFPGLCPMGQEPAEMPGQLTAKSGTAEAMLDELVAKVKDGSMSLEDLRAQLPVTGKPVTKGRKRPVAELVPATDASVGTGALVKAMRTEISKAVGTLPTRDELGSFASTYETRIQQQDDQIKALQGLVDKLGAMPDPAQAPNRGIAMSMQQQLSSGAGGASPERRSLVDEAAMQDRDARLKFARAMASSGDPGQRSLGEEQIQKLMQAS